MIQKNNVSNKEKNEKHNTRIYLLCYHAFQKEKKSWKMNFYIKHQHHLTQLSGAIYRPQNRIPYFGITFAFFAENKSFLKQKSFSFSLQIEEDIFWCQKI